MVCKGNYVTQASIWSLLIFHWCTCCRLVAACLKDCDISYWFPNFICHLHSNSCRPRRSLHQKLPILWSCLSFSLSPFLHACLFLSFSLFLFLSSLVLSLKLLVSKDKGNQIALNSHNAHSFHGCQPARLPQIFPSWRNLRRFIFKKK